MRYTVKDRNWLIDRDKIKFNNYIDKGIYFKIKNIDIHINIKLINKILKDKESDLILGGSWNDVNVILLVLFKRFRIIKNKIHFWSEANYLTLGASNDNLVKYYIRKFIFASGDGCLIVPGEISKRTFLKWGLGNRRFLTIPNTIDEGLLKYDTGKELFKKNKNDLPLFLMPVRLIENIKGILNFLISIGNDNCRKVIFIIAGTGPDRHNIDNYIQKNDLGKHVKMLGFCNSEKMIELYQTSDALVLPSFSDPNPISLIEGLAFKLPLLISNRCGNHIEGLRSGINGYSFDPYSRKDIQFTYELFLKKREIWLDMGNESRCIYDEIFSQKKIAYKLTQSIL
jgi:glycosyltransferase involved in cell wall biosynthesis